MKIGDVYKAEGILIIHLGLPKGDTRDSRIKITEDAQIRIYSKNVIKWYNTLKYTKENTLNINIFELLEEAYKEYTGK